MFVSVLSVSECWRVLVSVRSVSECKLMLLSAHLARLIGLSLRVG